MSFLTRLGLAGLAFAAVYSFFAQPILALFGWVGATYGVSVSPPQGPAMPGIGTDGALYQQQPGLGWFDFLAWLGQSILKFFEMTAYGTVKLFYDLGTYLASAVPDRQVGYAIQAFLTAIGALMQVAMWWTIVYAARGGQV
jgi:hypothetical protein